MSLVGSLEDLGLVDLLQIVGISRRSGVLFLRNEGEVGMITLQDGRVCGALVRGSPRDLHGLLVGEGHVEKGAFDAATAEAEATDRPIDAVLAERELLSWESLGSIRRRSVEQAVLKLLCWTTGEFCLEIREKWKDSDPPVLAPEGIRVEFLALEAARLDDEAGASGEPGAEENTGANGDPVVARDVEAEEAVGELREAEIGVLQDEVGGLQEAEVVAEPQEAEQVAELQSAEPFSEALPEAEELPTTELPVVEHDLEATTQPLARRGTAVRRVELDGTAAGPRPPAPQSVPGGPPPLVLIEADLAVLEWTKASLADLFSRIHIFQHCELGLARIRQYLVSLTTPLVFLSPTLRQDAVAGVAGSRLLLDRLKAQAPRMPVLWYAEAGSAGPEPIAPADGLLTRPAARQLGDSRFQEQNGEAARRLRSALLEHLSVDPRAVVHRSPLSPQQSLSFLKEATAQLSEAASRGEVLPVLMRFAAQMFARVAMFMVRDGRVVGLAQIGLEKAGGPGNEAIRDVAFAARDSDRLQQALSEWLPIKAAPGSDGDLRFLALLGDQIPSESYLAPVRSAGEPVALLYADNLPGARPIGDTTALEVVLHQAGLALDRAALELALAEARGAGPDRGGSRG